MRRLGFIADGHIHNHLQLGGPSRAGLNRRGQETVNVLHAARTYCEANDVDVLVSLGDLFHTTSPSPQVIAAVQEAIGEDLPTVLLLGNHEMDSVAVGHNALAPLAPIATIVETDQVIDFFGVELWLAGYRPGPAKKWLPEAVGKMSVGRPKVPEHPRVLCLHLGISDPDTPYWLDGSEDSVSMIVLDQLADRFNITHVLAGNWHRRKLWTRPGCVVLQVGALNPTGFNNPGPTGYGTIATLDDDGAIGLYELPGPRFLKAGSVKEVELQMQAVPHGSSVYVHFTVEPEQYDAAQEWLVKARSDLSVVNGKVDVMADTADANEEAVKLIRDAADGHEAIGHFVDAMEMPEGVEASEVKQKCKELMK